MKPSKNQEIQWINHLLGEVDDSEKKDIEMELETNPSLSSAYEDLENMITQLHHVYPKESHKMVELTLSQKKELYSSLSDVFEKKHQFSLIEYIVKLRILLLASTAAIVLMATVPIIQWISTVGNKKSIIENTNDIAFEPIPVVIETPPEKPEEKKIEEKQELKPPRIDLIDLELTQLETNINAVSIPIGNITVWEEEDLVSGILNIGDVDVIPSPQTKVAPIYPPSLKKDKIYGTVVVEFIVDEKGRVTKAVVAKSDHTDFERPALQAIKRWKFSPGKKNNQTVKVRMRIPFQFKVK